MARWCDPGLAWLAVADAEPARAADELHLAVDSGAPDELVVPHALSALAVLTAAAGDHARARSRAERAVEVAAAFPLPGVRVMALVRAGQVAARAGNGIGAILSELFDLLRRAGTRTFVAESLELAALAAARPGEAARYLGAARALRRTRAEPVPSLPALGVLVEHAGERARAALGEAAFAAAAAEGATADPRDLVTEIRSRRPG